MKRKIFRRISIVFTIIVIAWLVFANYGFKFRISDSKAKKKFSDSGIILFTETVKVNGFEMHYAKTGNDTLPAIFFVHGSPGGWNEFERYMQDRELLSKYRIISIDRPGFFP